MIYIYQYPTIVSFIRIRPFMINILIVILYLVWQSRIELGELWYKKYQGLPNICSEIFHDVMGVWRSTKNIFTYDYNCFVKSLYFISLTSVPFFHYSSLSSNSTLIPIDIFIQYCVFHSILVLSPRFPPYSLTSLPLFRVHIIYFLCQSLCFLPNIRALLFFLHYNCLFCMPISPVIIPRQFFIISRLHTTKFFILHQRFSSCHFQYETFHYISRH